MKHTRPLLLVALSAPGSRRLLVASPSGRRRPRSATGESLARVARRRRPGGRRRGGHPPRVERHPERPLEDRSPGRGLSSPVVWGDRLFLTTALEGEVVPGAKAIPHVLEGEPFVHPRRHRRRSAPQLQGPEPRRPRRVGPLGAHGVGGDPGRLASQEGQLRLPHHRHRRGAGLRLLRHRGPVRLRLRRGAAVELRPRAHRHPGRGHRDLSDPPPRPADPPVRRGGRRSARSSWPWTAGPAARSGAGSARSR